MTSKAKTLLLAIATSALCFSPAYANPQVVVEIFDQPDDSGAIGKVTHINLTDNVVVRMIETKTSIGTIVMRLNNTQNNLCDPPCPDTLEAWLLPDNVIASPQSVTTPEGGTNVIMLYEWNGM